MLARLLAVDGVREASLTLARDFQTNGERLAAFGEPVRLFERQVTVRITPMVNALALCALARALGYLALDVRVGAIPLRREIAVGLALLYEAQRGGAMLVCITRLEDDLLVVVR